MTERESKTFFFRNGIIPRLYIKAMHTDFILIKSIQVRVSKCSNTDYYISTISKGGHIDEHPKTNIKRPLLIVIF